MPDDGNFSSVSADSLSQSVGGLTSGEGALLRQLLALFPIPRPEHAAPLLAAIVRIAASVRWFETTTGFPGITDVAATLEARIVTRFGPVERLDVADKLTGSNYLLTRALIGKEPEPMPGPESLRAVLVACGLRWMAEGNRGRTALEQLGIAIRQITEHHLRPSGRPFPLIPHLKALGDARTLQGFITTSAVLSEVKYETLSSAWREKFLPALEAIAGAVPPQASTPSSSPQQQPSPLHDKDVEEDEENHDLLVNAIRRVVPQPAGGADIQIPGEPRDEITASGIVNAIPLARTDPDARKVARYLARQAIWGSNHLLLTNHPNVLPMHRLRRVVHKIMGELRQQAGTTDLALGLVALLLQAISGRTSTKLASFQLMTGSPRDREPGTCGLSLDQGCLELDVFWQLPPEDAGQGRPTGYFQPAPSEALYFQSADTQFRLPLHPIITEVLRPQARSILKLAALEPGRRDACLRLAARHVREKIGGALAPGDVRRSFTAHIYERARDMAMTQLIAADTLGQSDAPLHYYAPRKSQVAGVYWSFLNDLLLDDDPSDVPCEGNTDASPRRRIIDPPAPKAFESDKRIGVQGLLAERWARRLASTSGSRLNTGMASLLKGGRWRDIHEVLVTHLACMLMVVAGHRPVDALFKLSLGDIHLDRDGGAALFRDKAIDGAHDPRFVALAPCLVGQIQAYLAHLQGLAGVKETLATHVQQVIEGHAPLLFGVDEGGTPVSLTIASWHPSLPPEWRKVRLNWGRTWIRTRGVELGLSPEFASIQLGHLEAVGYPFSNGSPTVPMATIAQIAPHLEVMARLMGWRVRAGIPVTGAQKPRPALLPLRDWSAAIAAHEARAKEAVKQWRHEQAARISTFRQRAEQDVLSHPLLMERGIPQMLQGNPDATGATPLTRAEAEALRDVLFEQAGADPALGIARSWALRRILGRINKRLGIRGQDPAPLGMFRRPVDNAFVPGMMTGVRQIQALREHAVKLGNAPPGDWRDIPRAFARVAYVLAVFGFMEDQAQILGVLRNRTKAVAPASLPDAILVPWGDRDDQVVTLRNVPALALARLAKRYPGAPTPDCDVLNQALLDFLPDWALSTSGRNLKDPLALLCGTVGLANRFELSPAARYALDSATGSTPASMREQLALVDGDAVGTLARRIDAKDLDEDSPAASLPAPGGNANARSQYLALCHVIPKVGSALALPLTGVTIPASQLVGAKTRAKVIEEVDFMLGAEHHDKRLQPIVRLLALWVRRMLVEGTPQTRDPSDRTIETYLTRIGGTLVDWLGSGSLVDIDEVDLEEAYLAAILVGDTNRSQAASAILQFHECARRHYAMPEVDLAQILSFLRDGQSKADANLILPQERREILKRTAEQADSGPRDADPAHVRLIRQASAALPLFAWGGLRRSEALGLRVGDVWSDAAYTSIRVRRNRSRRIKTRAARRVVSFEPTRQPGLARFTDWVSTDSLRQHTWKRERAFVFSPLTAPGSAEGRDAIANACALAAADVTGRRNERLHRFRHLVAFDLVIPMFLSPSDASWVKDISDNGPPKEWGDVLLPRDLLGGVIELGHADWRVTLRSYTHMPWLLRSRKDAAAGEQYMRRRIVAFAAGLTLPGVDKIVQQARDLDPRLAWLNHFREVRTIPASSPTKAPEHQEPSRPWSAHELDALFRLADRMKSLDRAIKSSGGNSQDLLQIRRHLQIAERRIGRKFFRESAPARSASKRQRVVRSLDEELKRFLLDWMGGGNQEGTRVMRDMMEAMSPMDSEIILDARQTANALMHKLQEYPTITCSMNETQANLFTLRVRKLAPAHSNAATDTNNGLDLTRVIKLTAAIAWISDRLHRSSETP